MDNEMDAIGGDRLKLKKILKVIDINFSNTKQAMAMRSVKFHDAKTGTPAFRRIVEEDIAAQEIERSWDHDSMSIGIIPGTMKRICAQDWSEGVSIADIRKSMRGEP